MSEILSQAEVDALLKGVSDGAIPTERRAQGTNAVQSCDLTRQERALYGRMPGLDRIFDGFARSLRSSMEAVLGEIGGVALSGIELLRYGNWVDRFPPPVSVHMFRPTPLAGNGLVVLCPGLAAAALEVAFGGKMQRQTRVEGREYSGIETRVLQRFVARVLADFQDAWQVISPLQVSLVRSESNLAHAAVATEDAMVMVAEMRVLLEADDGLTLSICMPYAALDPIRSKLTGELDDIPEERGPGWGREFRSRLHDVRVGVAAELGSCQMSLRGILGLKAGDVLALETRKEQPVVVRVERLPKFYGVPGLSRTNHAIRIVDTVRLAVAR